MVSSSRKRAIATTRRFLGVRKNVKRRLFAEGPSAMVTKKKRRVSTFVTGRTVASSAAGFRNRRLSKRAFRRGLWRDTQFKSHYRSLGGGAATLPTPAEVGIGNLTEVDPFFVGTPGPTTAFWTAAGGTREIDEGEGVPTFAKGNMVIRGGIIGMTLNIQADEADTVNVKIWTVWKRGNPDATRLITPITYGSDPTAEAEFRNFGVVLDTKEVTLGTASAGFTLIRRLKPMKIDQEIFATKLGLHPVFLVAVTNLSDASVVNVSSWAWHNLSFTGDVESQPTP